VSAPLAKDGRPGCPVIVWDGPYSTRCGAGASVGKCAHHGVFVPAMPAPTAPTTQPEPGTSVEALLAEVLAEHEWAYASSIWGRCSCGSRSVNTTYQHRAHVASAQAAALAGMLPVGTVREEWGVDFSDPIGRGWRNGWLTGYQCREDAERSAAKLTDGKVKRRYVTEWEQA
jgi:hypothetical protein